VAQDGREADREGCEEPPKHDGYVRSLFSYSRGQLRSWHLCVHCIAATRPALDLRRG